MIPARKSDWPEALAAWTETAQPRVFVWGEWDCCLMAADAVLAITGHDFAKDLRGTYHNKTTARVALRNLGASTPARLASHLLGKSSPPLLAKRGDVVCMNRGQSLGICLGTHALFVTDKAAGQLIPLTEVEACWSI